MRDFRSKRVCKIPPSGIRKFFDIAQEMEDIISLGVGEPDYNTPWNVREAAIRSIEQGQTAYTSNSGLNDLRNEIKNYLKRSFDVSYDAKKEIIVTTGASEALDIAIRSVVDPGDEVLVADPSYIAYGAGVMLAGGIPVSVPCLEKDQFRLTPDSLMEKITPKSKVLLCNFPNNPSGGVMNRDDYKAISDIVVDHDLLLVSDEIYTELTYEGEKTSAASVDDLWERTITINGFSKAYSMTGWRIGYLCAPEEMCKSILKIHQYVMLSAPTTAQYAGIEALRNGADSCREMVQEYKIRRNLFVKGLNRAGLETHMPKGAFYAFPSVKSFGISDEEFAERLLKEYHVAVVPGSVFGPSGKNHLRCSYAVSREDLMIAVGKIEEFISTL
ncbi:aminotransferase class I/II-fold pyridoxal phosphate-dependent enzyme [Methanoplanus sp. FWC-SCC4]|uniref:Aminotransferase n=1 Tax=Methanochimaera problematica TaxID=2609417 RepID=A0AA97FDR2_9EURY|nr:aminotransferase class I/II-fold pyridoxal phosphate-dependent enzyme [Methanoplanus sp. FWC-SCC4]WOF17182.1 aminotransferase class I/II-fold pyridoxal phosphate-dependent enzyme [Methanoplanus sp. FWC-SCC4]